MLEARVYLMGEDFKMRTESAKYKVSCAYYYNIAQDFITDKWETCASEFLAGEILDNGSIIAKCDESGLWSYFKINTHRDIDEGEAEEEWKEWLDSYTKEDNKMDEEKKKRRAAHMKEYDKLHKDKRRGLLRKYYQENREKVREKRKRLYQE